MTACMDSFYCIYPGMTRKRGEQSRGRKRKADTGVNGESCQRLPLNTANSPTPTNFRIHSQRPDEQEEGVGVGLES